MFILTCQMCSLPKLWQLSASLSRSCKRDTPKANHDWLNYIFLYCMTEMHHGSHAVHQVSSCMQMLCVKTRVFTEGHIIKIVKLKSHLITDLAVGSLLTKQKKNKNWKNLFVPHYKYVLPMIYVIVLKCHLLHLPTSASKSKQLGCMGEEGYVLLSES